MAPRVPGRPGLAALLQASQAATQGPQGDARLFLAAGRDGTRPSCGWLFLAGLPYKEAPSAQADLLADLRAARHGALVSALMRAGLRDPVAFFKPSLRAQAAPQAGTAACDCPLAGHLCGDATPGAGQ